MKKVKQQGLVTSKKEEISNSLYKKNLYKRKLIINNNEKKMKGFYFHYIMLIKCLLIWYKTNTYKIDKSITKIYLIKETYKVIRNLLK